MCAKSLGQHQVWCVAGTVCLEQNELRGEREEGGQGGDRGQGREED